MYYVHNGCLQVGHGSPHYTADRVGGVGGPSATFFYFTHKNVKYHGVAPPPHTHTFCDLRNRNQSF